MISPETIPLSALDSIFFERFLPKIDTSGGVDACWGWLGSKSPKGYGSFRLVGKIRKAHRIALVLKYGRNTDLHALHKCDNPSCCNPRHIEAGTNDENQRQRAIRGDSSLQKKRASDHLRWFQSSLSSQERSRRGRLASSKLTMKQANQIRLRYSKGANEFDSLAS